MGGHPSAPIHPSKRKAARCVISVHGLEGSGKSTLVCSLLEAASSKNDPLALWQPPPTEKCLGRSLQLKDTEFELFEVPFGCAYSYEPQEMVRLSLFVLDGTDFVQLPMAAKELCHLSKTHRWGQEDHPALVIVTKQDVPEASSPPELYEELWLFLDMMQCPWSVQSSQMLGVRVTNRSDYDAVLSWIAQSRN